MKKLFCLFALVIGACVPAFAQHAQPIPGSSVITCITTPLVHTGDTGADWVFACKIPAGTLAVGSTFEVHAQFAAASGNVTNGEMSLSVAAAPSSGTGGSDDLGGLVANKIEMQEIDCTVQSSSTINCGGVAEMDTNLRLTDNATNSVQSLSVTSDIYVNVAMRVETATDTAYLRQLFIRIN